MLSGESIGPGDELDLRRWPSEIKERNEHDFWVTLCKIILHVCVQIV